MTALMTVNMNKPTIDEVLAPKPEAHPRIYAYAIADAAHHGWLKVGQTTRDVKQRVNSMASRRPDRAVESGN